MARPRHTPRLPPVRLSDGLPEEVRLFVAIVTEPLE